MLRLTYAEWGWREYFAAMGLGCRGDNVAALLAALAWSLDGRPILPVNRARTGLWIALQTFAVARPGKTEVIVPAYICSSVVDTVRSCGLNPVPADIGPDLNISAAQLPALCSSKTLAVIAAHMYACPAPIAEIERFCREAGIFLVDDAAQVIGIRIGNRPLGTFGDAGLLSFSQSKTIVAGAFNPGGLVIVNNHGLAERLRGQWDKLPSGRYQLRDIFTFLWDYQLERLTETPTYLANQFLDRLYPRSRSHNNIARKMAHVSAAIGLAQLAHLDRRISGRVRVAADIQLGLRDLPAVAFPQFAPDRYLTRVILALPHDRDVRLVQMCLRKMGIRTRRGYEAVRGRDGTVPSGAASLVPHLLELPSRSDMPKQEIDRMCRALAATLGKAATRWRAYNDYG